MWKSLLLKKTTKEKRRNWKRYALPGVFASLALIMNKGKRIEKRQPLFVREKKKRISHLQNSHDFEDI